MDKSYFLASEMNFATLLKSKDKHKELQGFDLMSVLTTPQKKHKTFVKMFHRAQSQENSPSKDARHKNESN